MMPGPGFISGIQQWLVSPLTRWGQTSMMHKLAAAGAAVGLGYYLHDKGMSDTTVGLAALGAAYGASMLMHYPAMAGQMGMAMPGSMTPMLPAAPNVGPMAARASRSLASRGVRPTAMPPGLPQPQPAMQQQAASGQWAALG